MKEEIPGLAQYLPDELETADLVGKTVPPTKCIIKKGFNYYETHKRRKI